MSTNSEIYTHPSTFKASILLKQLEERDQVCAHWLMMSLHRLTIEKPNMTVKELIDFFEFNCPNAMLIHQQRIKQQNG